MATLIEFFRSSTSAVSVKKFADKVGIHENNVYTMIGDGRLPAYRVGKGWRIDPEDAAQWLEKRYTRKAS